MADLNLRQFPPPPYATSTTQTLFNPQEDLPGPRCGHTLTAVYHRLILFGGVTLVPSGGSDNSLQCLTNSVYCLNSLTKKWTRVYPEGEPPSPRTNHAAVSCGDGVIIQGGIGPSGICNGDLHVLDMSSDTFKWKKVVVQEGMAPCPRYGHVMGLAGEKLVIFGGINEGNLVLADTWALNTTRHPNVWEILYPYGDLPCGRVYASASSTRDHRYFMLNGGRDQHGMPLGDTYKLEPFSSSGFWVWTRSPHLDLSKRYQHAAVFVNLRLHVFGGALSNTHLVDAEEAVSVLDTSTGVWVDTSNEVMRRSLHAAASIGSRIYVYGGIREGVLLDDLLISGELLSSGPTVPSFLWRSQNTPRPPASDMNDGYKPNFSREKLHDLVNKVISTLLRPQTWEPPVDRKFFLSFPELAELCFAAKQIIEQEPTVLQLYAPIKVFGDLHGQFGDLMRLFYEYGYPSRQGDIAYIDYLFLGDYVDRGKHSLETIILLLALKVEYPKNIHLIRGNHEAEATNTVYGFLDECIERIVRVCQSVHRIYIFYLFLANEVMIIFFSVNHQECNDGNRAFKLINDFFSHLPLAALIEKKIFCVHGGIGSSVFTMEQITNIKRPVDMDCEYNYKVVKDLLWSDPTAHDSILGIGVNERGSHIVSFGPDRVNAFCERNDIDMIIRGHECVLDGFERFAQGKLITVFSATNYCGKFKNAGAILVIGRNLDVVPKLIHPLPPPISPSENVPDKAWIEVDRERPPTPIRGQRKPDFEQGSTS
ncbi:serine/threonine-protein phosphatase BSL1 homolog isoform X2 [Brassica rapa]|uniref:serine/threonine-protein phosphatase BSL1 homolog isoform X2 n=1 Tax=Brassica campestris TaxID=3711 RepID=UPI00142D361C|nr:serine/threonine-protein phosphatase BSL1 homolog isoform X2 [Brassica rapa]